MQCRVGRVRVFRAGIWKPRTRPGGFEGVGSIGLPWLRRVKEETGMFVSTEAATRAHVEAAVEAGIDMLWIGARTSANPFAMQEIADTLRDAGSAGDLPVLVKNPVNPDLELWIGAIQRIRNEGLRSNQDAGYSVDLRSEPYGGETRTHRPSFAAGL